MLAKLTEQDFHEAAALLRCDLAAIKTVAEVEARGAGFRPDGKPVILFERHIFHRYTRGKFDNSHPSLSNEQPGGYGVSAAQWSRYEEAAKLDQRAARLSISMGLFQVMGFNFQAAGFPSVDTFFDAMHKSEREHLIAFCRFLKAVGLDDELRDHEWRAFAHGYNGPAYRKNQYDTKLAAAYKRFAQADGDVLELDFAPLPSASQIDFAPDASVAIPPAPPTVIAPPPPTVSITDLAGQIEAAKATGQTVSETVAAVAVAVGKARDSVKAFRTFIGMVGFGTTLAGIGGWSKDNPVLSLLMFVGVAIVALFAWKYMSRQEKIAVERIKNAPLP